MLGCLNEIRIDGKLLLLGGVRFRHARSDPSQPSSNFCFARDVLQVFSSGKIRRPLDDVWVLTEGRHPALFLSSLNLRTYSFALQRPA